MEGQGRGAGQGLNKLLFDGGRIWHRHVKLDRYRRREIIVRGQSYFSRLPKYWPPIPISARRVCTPCLCCGGRTDSPGGEGDGGSIFWKTREIGLPSYNDLSTVIGVQSFRHIVATLQMHSTENWKQKFPEMELRSLVPNFSIHVFVIDLFIYYHDLSANAIQQNRQTDRETNKSLTDTWL